MTQVLARLQQLVQRLQDQARRQRHRRLLLLSGEAGDCRGLARELLGTLSATEVLWVGDSAPGEIPCLNNRQALERLGGELDLLVYDAFSGFDQDAFGALGGTLRGGGMLLLLSPPLDAWHLYPDPARNRLLSAGLEPEALKGHFLARLAALLQSDPFAVRVLDGVPLDDPPAADHTPEPPAAVDGECLTGDQAQAVEAILRVVQGHRHRPLVLSSDRGRGKSSALGIAAARMMRKGERHILVTGPRRSAVEALFRQATRLLPEATLEGGELHFEQARLVYSAPDHLLARPQPADLLLVDEAAAIPTALLEGLLEHYPRIVFATTEHGYEGTGRGFALRFRAHLERTRPQWRELRLEAPIRWAADDPLETLLFRLLGLDAEPATYANVVEATPDNVETQLPDSGWLANHETTLQQLFGLLVLAHYRTTPLDLRLLLDAPKLQTLLLRQGDAVVGAALLSDEGGFDDELCREIWAGRRRPKGHLMAQSLAAHVGIATAPALRGLRVVRIAIHPAVQRRGLGSRLMQAVRELARDRGFDYLGTSFGASERLFGFWRRNDLEPVRLGLRTGTSSGDHALLMITPLNKAGLEMSREAGQRFARQLPALLADPLRDLPPELASRLLGASAVGQLAELDARDWSDLSGFCFARRGYETCLPAIEQLSLLGLGDESGLAGEARRLLVLRVIQKRDWGECARLNGLSGRGETERRLREILGELYHRFIDRRIEAVE